jgi:hypothetical protein
MLAKLQRVRSHLSNTRRKAWKIACANAKLISRNPAAITKTQASAGVDQGTESILELTDKHSQGRQSWSVLMV